MAYYMGDKKVINNSGELIAPSSRVTQFPEVKIGTQIWMAKNLNVTHYRDGTPILDTFTDDWSFNTLGGYIGVYKDVNEDPGLADIYGKLYNWYAVNGSSNASGLAPEGWHIPSKAEGDVLDAYLATFTGGTGNRGSKLAGEKELWNSSDNTLVNDPQFAISGFNAVPAGAYDAGAADDFSGFGDNFWMWFSDSENNSKAWNKRFYYTGTGLTNHYTSKWAGMSVRCIKDT